MEQWKDFPFVLLDLFFTFVEQEKENHIFPSIDLHNPSCYIRFLSIIESLSGFKLHRLISIKKFK